MKTSSTLLLFLILTISGSAQKLPSFGKIDKEDLLYKECSYDKNADAECLIDYGEVNYFVISNSIINELDIRVRIKVFNEKGLSHANVRIPFYSKGNRDYVSKITGVTFNLNDNGEIEKTELEKNSIYKQKINQYYDEMVFSLPNVKAGSVIEYKYRVAKKDVLRLENWTFQRRIPVRFSMYDAGIPTPLQFTYRVIRTLPAEEKTESGIQGVKRKIFVMKNIPGLNNEPHMSSASDYYQRVEFQLTGIGINPVPGNTWKDFAVELLQDEDFGLQIKKNVLKNLPLESVVKSISDPIVKINTIYQFVQRQVAWNGSNSYWTENGVKQALEKHEGNSADINLLLLNLLLDADIKAYPILVSTRDHGRINIAFPFHTQFNNVYVYVDLPDNPLVLDASNKNSPYYIGPWDVQFTNAFLVDKSYYKIVSIGDIKHTYKLTSIVNAEINNEGEIKGNAKVYSSEYARIERLSVLRKNSENYKTTYFTEPHPGYTFDSVVTINLDKDSLPLENHVNFSGKLNTSGEYLFYKPNFLLEMDKNPFLDENRFTHIEFGYNQKYTLTANITFPQNYEPEELPQNIKMILPDTSIILHRAMQKNENTISYRIVLEIKRPIYYNDEYPDFKEFFTALMDKLNEEIVFKKKG
jgi:hypothetical protein